MDSWWQLGEGHGYHGHELAMYQITCPFCMEITGTVYSNAGCWDLRT